MIFNFPLPIYPSGGWRDIPNAIAFSLPGGEITDTLFSWAILQQVMFQYRHRVTQHECEQNAKHG